jgi:hypothetical protein
MDFGQAANHLELAFIELEYARADFAHTTASTSEQSDVSHLESALVKLTVADLALQIAICALGAASRIPERQHDDQFADH